MDSNLLEINKIYKAKIIEEYKNDFYQIAIKISHYFYSYDYNFICKIINNKFDITQLNTLLNQYQQELYVKIININKIITVEIKTKELDQYINLF